MREYTGLDGLREPGSSGIACPKCRSDLTIVPNGFFHGELFYCESERKVFRIALLSINPDKEFLEQCESHARVGNVRKRINKDNVKSVMELLNSDNTLEPGRSGAAP